MFAVGHLALGYISGKGIARFLDVSVNVPLMFLASVLPDIDFLVPGLMHRGPMHSIVLYALVFVPIIILYRKIGVIYFLCVAQHLLIGDFLTAGYGGGIQLLWPLTSNWYSAGIHLAGAASVYLEWAFFIMCFAWMLKAGDMRKLLIHNRSNLVLAMPVLSIVLPVFFEIPLPVPFFLLVPHIIFLSLLCLSILIDLKAFSKHSTSSLSRR